jgi:hypothetical protein
VEIEIDPAALMGCEHGFLIRGEGTWNREVDYSFFSREYINAGVHPQLVVEYEGP